MNYCSHCGAPVVLRVPSGDHLPRYVCERCSTVHYQNPKIVAGCIAEWNDTILLCKRAIEPQLGRWTLPAGFMENGETAHEAGARETWEEAQAKVADLSLFSMISLPHISQVYIMFRGQLVDGTAAPGPESLEVKLCRQNDIPWDDIAFPVIREVLNLYFSDRARGVFPVHLGDVVRNQDRSISIRRY